ncbi:hypothetical protein H310_12573 [Aphanomyces invadans]|uniref:Helicase C-terminal domain-containing protein n=1 Tax=Aphanomyces invadans TaxID=157072 RepID=A0A024TJQ3_9STRA|nr:hypothetical protein H310_12573 [Aphanomyces invadans]ETV93577.1 hypothetical protein H310_12573 [Aphanomyces invadans]|eukprot:XP_008877919.1 hypothetical protein H310_12573 [Aphanomyces invadans]
MTRFLLGTSSDLLVDLVIFAPFNKPQGGRQEPPPLPHSAHSHLASRDADAEPSKLAAIGIPHAELITVNDALDDKLFATPANLDESMIEELLHTFESQLTIIFTSSIIATNRLCRLLQLFSSELHGLTQKQRSQLVQQCKKCAIKVVVCSDAMARGMDIAHVCNVINFVVPPYLMKTLLPRYYRVDVHHHNKSANVDCVGHHDLCTSDDLAGTDLDDHHLRTSDDHARCDNDPASHPVVIIEPKLTTTGMGFTLESVAKMQRMDFHHHLQEACQFAEAMVIHLLASVAHSRGVSLWLAVVPGSPR